jgi:hypothetical protein
MKPSRQILALPANLPCPGCSVVVQDWHTEWTDPALAPDFNKGLRAIDCPLCGQWVLYKGQKLQAIPPGDNPQPTKRLPLQAARWAKSQSKPGNLRDYLNQTGPGRQYSGYLRIQSSWMPMPMLQRTRGISHGAYRSRTRIPGCIPL